MTLEQILKYLLEVANPVFALVGVVATLVFGYRQWKGGKRNDEIGSAAEHIVSSADKLVDMKDDEIEKLNARLNAVLSKFEYQDRILSEQDKSIASMRVDRDRDRLAIVSLTEEVGVLKQEVRRSDDALSYLVTQVGEHFPDAVEVAWKIRRGELRL